MGVDPILRKKIGKQLSGRRKKGAYLFICRDNASQEVAFAILDSLANRQNQSGVFVTAGIPYYSLVSSLDNFGIETKNILFIDAAAVTRNPAANAGGRPNRRHFIRSGCNIVALSLAIDDALSTGKYGFLFLDSVSTFMLHNSFEDTEAFTEFIMSKLLAMGIEGIVFCLEGNADPRLQQSLSKICEKVVYV